MPNSTMWNLWNQAESLLKWKQNSNVKISWRQPSSWAIYLWKFTTLNPKFIKICHQMRGTGQNGPRRNKKRTSGTKNHCCQKNLHTIQSVRFNHQRTNYSKKDQYWIPEKRNTTVHYQPSKMFSMPEIWTHQNSCKHKAVCAGCGEEGHNLDDCQNEAKCVNCQGDHVAISRDCPKWKIEKDIVTLKYTEKISFADARKRLQPSFDPSKDSYATVTQTPPQSSRPLPPWAKKNPTSNWL